KYPYSLEDIKKLMKKDILPYEDSLIFAYLKGKLEGFIYEGNIRQVVIDEAQDYNRLQYIIINQNINPYYKYKDLRKLEELFNDSKYIELLKTYRSSPEIIDYTNKILHLNHVNAIRKSTNKPVLIRKNIGDLKNRLIEDIRYLKDRYKSMALITKDSREAEVIYELVKDDVEISLVDATTKSFYKECIIIPAYVSKGLEFDSVIIYNNRENTYKKNERNLLYVACSRCQHELIIYN
ncbi:MAG: ATP-binding domain-containing protein, partial [Bacilli bacterium]|nr:ATP-binding domain-containing protein [Bacilli bacterium]